MEEKELVKITKEDLVKFIAKGYEAKIENLNLIWNKDLLRMVGIDEYGEIYYDRASFFQAINDLLLENLPVNAIFNLEVPIILFKYISGDKTNVATAAFILNNVDGIDFAVFKYIDLPQEFVDKIKEKDIDLNLTEIIL